MKVWKYINQVKGTKATRKTILSWMEMNRICPLIVEDGLEAGDLPELNELANKHCLNSIAGAGSYNCIARPVICVFVSGKTEYEQSLKTEARP